MTPTLNRTRPTRPGFTLVELLVAMALSLGIMVILTEAFKISLDFTRHTGATARLINQLNGAEAALKRDLHADHFLNTADVSGQSGKLIDQRLDKLTKFGTGWTPPRGGFFRIVSGATNVDATDRDFINITSTQNHALHFTSILPGGTEENLYSVSSPAGSNAIYTSRAAEIAYFLAPMQGNSQTSQGGLPLYNLIRRYRLVAMTDDDRPALQQAVTSDPSPFTHPEVISVPTVGAPVNTLADVQKSGNRMALGALPVSSNRYGDDILVSNVLSFQVLADWDRNANPAASAFPRGQAGPRSFGANTDFPFDYLAGPSGNSVFDTTPSNPNDITTLSQAIRVKSLQISVRVFDPGVKTARQSTWVFDP